MSTKEENLQETSKNYALCKAEGLYIYFTMSETTAAFAELTIRSLKKILYRYMEDYGVKYVHKLPHFGTTLNSGKSCSKDLIPKNVKRSDFLSILYSKPLREYKNPSLILETEFASPSMTYPSTRTINHNLFRKILKLLQYLPENLEQTQKGVNRMRLIVVNFVKKSSSKSFNDGIFLQ